MHNVESCRRSVRPQLRGRTERLLISPRQCNLLNNIIDN